MENIFKKFLGKCWVIYQRPEIARLLFRQICEDTRTYLRRVMSSECALMDLDDKTKGVRRSMSSPDLKRKCP